MRKQLFETANGRLHAYDLDQTLPTKLNEDFGIKDVCGYDIHAGWGPERCPNEPPCPEHGDKKCWVCGDAAKFACSYTQSLGVCGAPLCENHRNAHSHG